LYYKNWRNEPHSLIIFSQLVGLDYFLNILIIIIILLIINIEIQITELLKLKFSYYLNIIIRNINYSSLNNYNFLHNVRNNNYLLINNYYFLVFIIIDNNYKFI